MLENLPFLENARRNNTFKTNLQNTIWDTYTFEVIVNCVNFWFLSYNWLTFHFYGVFKLHLHNFAISKTKYQNIQFTNCPCWCSDYCYLQQTIVILEPQSKVFVWLRSFNMPLPHMMHTVCVKQAKHTTNSCCRNTMRRITTLQHYQVLLCCNCQVFFRLSEIQYLL